MLTTFYEAVLPGTDQGHYCLFMLGSKQHVWAHSLDSLADHTEARSESQGVYFATASFVEPTSRTQANVLALKALRLDIDAGAKKHEKSPTTTYPTQRDALAAVIAFSQATRLAPSFIVSSGEGLHIYYALDEAVAPATWLPLATRLGELCTEHGLRADPSVTTDSARVLRPIGTLHPNGSRVEIKKATGKVYSIGDITAVLGVAPLAPARVYDLSVNDDVAAPVGPPKSLAKIVENCPAMAEVSAARGDVQEPFWRAMLGVVKFTVEGVDGAHELSSGHPDYDPAETEKKFDAWSTGPTSCAEFAKHTAACAACPYRGKVKSPVMLGLMTVPEVESLPPEKQPPPPAPPAPTGDPWDGCLPASYIVTRKGNELTLVYMMDIERATETGDVVKVTVPVPFTHSVFWFVHWAEASTSDDTAQAIMYLWDQKDHKINVYPMEQSVVASQQKLLEYLASKAIQVTNHKKAAAAMTDYVRAQLHRIKMLSKRPKIGERFGMRILPTGELVCAHGKHVIYPDGKIQNGMLSEPLRNVQDAFPIAALPEAESGEWPLTVWDDYVRPAAAKYADFLRTHYNGKGLGKYRLTLMLGLASPFMAFVTGAYHSGAKLPPNGLSVSLYSRQGGRGKTTLVQALMLAFGDPGALVKDSGGNGSTDIARIVKLSLWGTMPMSMEEMGNAKESSITSLISSVANGSGRERGTKSGGMTAAAQWALINFITTNRAQRDMVAATQEESSAIQYRLLELNVDNTTFDREAIAKYTADWSEVLRDSAGAMGALLEYKACQLGPERLNKLVTACVTKAAAALQANQDARFQYRALGAMLFVHTLLAQENIVMFDLADLVNEFKDAHTAGVAYVAENVLPTNGLELMQMMLSDLKPRTLITETETHRGIDKTRYDIPLNNRIPDVVLARHVTTLGWTYVTGAAVREWCSQRKVSERDLLSDCKNAGMMVPQDKRFPNKLSMPMDLFKGTKEAGTATARCYRVDTRMLRRALGIVNDDETGSANVVPITPKAKPLPAAPQPQGATP